MSRGDDLHQDEIPPGTLYPLITRTLARSGEMHGYEIANSVQRISDDVLQVEEGSLYPALQRMLVKGWVTAKWGTATANRRARYHQLTAKK
jgi:PadR family transcriptional regulator PadR